MSMIEGVSAILIVGVRLVLFVGVIWIVVYEIRKGGRKERGGGGHGQG